MKKNILITIIFVSSVSVNSHAFDISGLNSGMTRSEVNSYFKNDLGYKGTGGINTASYTKVSSLNEPEEGVFPVSAENMMYNYSGELYQATLEYDVRSLGLDEDFDSSAQNDAGIAIAFQNALKDNISISNFSQSGIRYTFTVTDMEMFEEHHDHMKNVIENRMGFTE